MLGVLSLAKKEKSSYKSYLLMLLELKRKLLEYLQKHTHMKKRKSSMYPKIYILDSYIPTYWLCSLIGMAVAILLLNHLLLERLILRKYIGAYLLSCVGLLVGAKCFGFLSKLLGNYAYTGLWEWKDSFLHSGIVYLGGLLGYLGMLRILCCFKERKWNEISNITAIIIPLFHAFGRIGCFFAGCCYGTESNSWIAIPYRIVLTEEQWVNRIPVQLMESAVELCLFVLCYLWYRKKKREGKEQDNQILAWYLLFYSIWRFIIEFWRGDEVRGVFGWVSFSQIICSTLILIIFNYKIKLSFGGKDNEL